MAQRPYQGAVDVEIPIEEIVQTYSGFADEIIERLAERAVLKIRENAKQFRVKTGTLLKRIRKKRSKYNNHTYIAGAMAPHAHLLEYGHAIVRNGVILGHVPARPFVKPAEETVKNEITSVARDVLGEKAITITRGNHG